MCAERTLTDFVVDAAVVEAERLLADRREFALEAERWERFVELLDLDSRDILAALRRIEADVAELKAVSGRLTGGAAHPA